MVPWPPSEYQPKAMPANPPSCPSIVPIILMVSPRASSVEAIARAVKAAALQFQTRRADDVAMALARLAGGGIHSVLVDVSGQTGHTASLESVRRLRASLSRFPIIFWSDTEDSSLAALAAQAGVSGWLTPGSTQREIIRLLSGADSAAPTAPGVDSSAPAIATIVTLMGVKGGVGTTTVAMNIAAALTSHGSVILAEIRPMFGTLATFFQPGRMVRGFPGSSPSAPEADVVRSLWPVPGVPGLRILFGPQAPPDCAEISAATATSLLRKLSSEADFVVVDLPPSLSPSSASILGASHHLALVVNPLPACLKLGNSILEGIRLCQTTPTSIGSVVVRLTSEGTPTSPAEIEAEMGVSILAIVPPAPELATQGERTRLPLVQSDPQSMVAEGFTTLAHRFPRQTSRPRS